MYLMVPTMNDVFSLFTRHQLYPNFSSPIAGGLLHVHGLRTLARRVKRKAQVSEFTVAQDTIPNPESQQRELYDSVQGHATVSDEAYEVVDLTNTT